MVDLVVTLMGSSKKTENYALYIAQDQKTEIQITVPKNFEGLENPPYGKHSIALVVNRAGTTTRLANAYPELRLVSDRGH